MKIGLNIKYLCAFAVVLLVEIFIAIFASNNFIRDYIGDVLVVVLIYCFIKSFIKNDIKLLWLYIFVFASLIEVGQYFNFVNLLGLGKYKIARIILGETFDFRDIVSYFAGCLGIGILEKLFKMKNTGGRTFL